MRRARRRRAGDEVDGDAEGFEDVGGTAEGGDGAVAVLGDGGAGGGGDEGGGGGDVEVPLASPPVPQVSTRSGCSMSLRGSMVSGVAESCGEAGDFGGGFAAGGQGAEQGGEFDVAGLAGEDALHERGGFGKREGFALFEDAAEMVLDGHGFEPI